MNCRLKSRELLAIGYQMKLIAASLLMIVLVAPAAILDDRAVSLNSLRQSFSETPDHNCRLYAAISYVIPDSVIYHDLVSFPQALKVFSVIANIDGWGIAYYPDTGSVPGIERSPLRACADPRFDTVAAYIDSQNCSVVMAHIRGCTSGCCCRGCFTVTDPHPFVRYKDSRSWSFAHNGTIDKALLRNLIGHDYLAQNPPDGSGVPECDPADTSLVTDSELFFILLLKHIEQGNWDVTMGLREALTELIYAAGSAELNFTLSDSHELWSFRKGNSLFFLQDSLNNYSAVASEFTTFYQENWQRVPEYTLLHMRAGNALEIIDIREFLAPIVSCSGDTSLLFVPARDVCLGGFDVFDPDTNLVEVTINTGTYNNGRVCFRPVDGPNLIILSARDRYDNTGACSTVVDAVLSEPGTLRGNVADTSHVPLESVTVFIRVAEITDSTDLSGNFEITDIVPGVYDITFSKYGFMDTTAQDVEIFAQGITELDIILRPGCSYVAGDANASGEFNGVDVTFSVNYLKGLGPAPADSCDCPLRGVLYSAADANGNCVFNGVDVTYSVNYLKGFGRPPQGCGDCPPVAE